jgi:ABC-type transport system involved in multi-copper enzyme maturation permease subunit
MKMLLPIARFEFRYLLRHPLLWLTVGITFILYFVGISSGLELGNEGGLLANAAFATVSNYLMTSLAFMFVTTAFVANAVIRDDETGYGPIVRSTPITRHDYLLGRFLGAFAVAALCLLLLPLAIVLGSTMPWTDPATVGPNRLGDHLYGYFLIALPNLFVHSAVFFALATITRSMMATYLGVVGFMTAFFVIQGAGGPVAALLDPFALAPLDDAVQYWTPAERNVMLPRLAGALLHNRLLWMGLAIGCLGLAHGVYRFADAGISRRARKRRQLAGRAAEPARALPGTPPLPAPRHGPAALRALLLLRTRFEVRQVVLHPAFLVLMAWASYVTGMVLLTQRGPEYPTTRSMIPQIDEPMTMLLSVIAIYYAGELVWRERDRRVDGIIDATPMPTWAYVVPKTLALAVVFAGILVMSVLASIAVQLSLGFAPLELGNYLAWLVVPKAWDLLLLAVLAVFVQALSPHKAVGWGIMVLLAVAEQLNGAVDHNLVLYGGIPGVPLSDMNGTAHFAKGAWTFRVYWGAFAVLLLVAAHLMWRRGTDVRLAPRLAHARRRARGTPGLVAAGAALAFLAAGGYAYYNTNVLNTYRSPLANLAHMAAYEKKYGRYVGLAQPKVVDLTLDVALHPEERRAVTRGRFVLRNLTAQPIPEIHVRTFDALQLARATIAGARLASDEPKYGYRIYRLHRPMQPGEERVMEFETRLHLRGFRNQPTFTRLVENGTFLIFTHVLPGIGAAGPGMIQDPAVRRRYGLPEAPRLAKLEDLAATANTTPDRGWAKSDITVSTPADQVPLAPGNKVSDEVRGGRRVARFVSGVPVHPRFSIQSARYAEKHRLHRGIDLAVYHHPGHAWNVDRMLDALAASLDYFQANFGPYPFDHARIVEFPGYLDFAQAFPGTIPWTEEAFDNTEPGTMDFVTLGVAHELAHMYWSHQVIGADMEGREVLSETLAQYSSMMVMKRLAGEDYRYHMRPYLRNERAQYLAGRQTLWRGEPALVRVNGEDHVTYHKGAHAMYLIEVRLGEDRVNRALRSLIARYGFRHAPFPRSLDLVAALRAQARTAEEQQLITDLFERVTLYDLKVTAPAAVRRADGRWDVTVPVQARKLYADGRGGETEAPLNERIEIGLFSAEPGPGVVQARNVVVLERRPVRSGAQVVRFVTDRKPTHAYIDPYNYYMDRNYVDNVLPVEGAVSGAAPGRGGTANPPPVARGRSIPTAGARSLQIMRPARTSS